MKRLLLFVLLISSPVWCSSILGMTTPENQRPEGDSEIEATVPPKDSNNLAEDTLNKEVAEQPMELETVDSQSETLQANYVQKRNATDWFSLIIALIALGVSGFVYLNSKNNTKNKSLEDKKMDLNKKIDDTRIDIEVLQRKIDLIEYEKKDLDNRLEKICQSILDLRSKVSVQTEAHQQVVTPPPIQTKSDKEKPSPYQVSYLSSLSMDDSGELTIPIWSLDQNNTQALFRVKFDPSSGTGFYELNPNVDNISTRLDTLKNFSDGVTPSKISGYKTKEPGKLRKEGGELKVITRLKVE